MQNLPAADRARLTKLMGMLGSAHEGERAAAAAKATELLQRHRLTWAEFLASSTPSAAAPAPRPKSQKPRETRPWRDVLVVCLERIDRMTEWEREFLASLQVRAARSDGLSKKQYAVLMRCKDKAERNREDPR